MSSDLSVLVDVIQRLGNGWELYDDHGTMRWYSPTKPGFDDVLPTAEEIAAIEDATQ